MLQTDVKTIATFAAEECDVIGCHEKFKHYLFFPWGSVAVCQKHWESELDKSAQPDLPEKAAPHV